MVFLYLWYNNHNHHLSPCPTSAPKLTIAPTSWTSLFGAKGATEATGAGQVDPVVEIPGLPIFDFFFSKNSLQGQQGETFQAWNKKCIS